MLILSLWFSRSSGLFWRLKWLQSCVGGSALGLPVEISIRQSLGNRFAVFPEIVAGVTIFSWLRVLFELQLV